MTTTQAFRVVCEAAALEDAPAADLLRHHIARLPQDDDGKGLLLVALAWLAPAEARNSLSDVGIWGPSIQGTIERLWEAHQLCAESEEAQHTYAVMTALLPQGLPTTERRIQIHWLATALNSPEEFLARPDWSRYVLEPFLAARLWHHHTESFWSALQQDTRVQVRFTSMGMVVLANRAGEQDIPILLELLKDRGHWTPFIGLEASALFQVIGVLETRAPQEMAALTPGILRALGRGQGEKDSILTARVLVLLARLGLSDIALLNPLIERIRSQPNHRVSRRWVRHVVRIVRQLEPKPTQAQAHARLLRVLALEETLESALTRKLNRRTPAQVRRAWRWLQKSDRVIETVADAEWRQRLYRSKEHLEQKVRQSRKAVHIAARAE
ncbi:MAG: hypothetical protein QM758_03880 [Armatimonas sp.]